MEYQVECVTTDDSSAYNDCRCIDSIGIHSIIGGIDEYSPEEIHDRIEEEEDSFYVEYRGSKTYLETASHGSTRYVRTEQNDTTADNLLKQPSC